MSQSDFHSLFFAAAALPSFYCVVVVVVFVVGVVVVVVYVARVPLLQNAHWHITVCVRDNTDCVLLSAG